MIPKQHLKNRTALLVITLLYSAISAMMFHHFGIKYVNDSHRYLEYAQELERVFSSTVIIFGLLVMSLSSF
jgi:hypothetical protein